MKLFSSILVTTAIPNFVKQVWLFFIVLFTFPFSAQSKQFSNFSVNEGLPDRLVRTIAQDELGFIWIGTPQGLVRFDGYNFKYFKTSNNDPYIQSIHKDNFSNFYLGHRAKGLSLKEKALFRSSSIIHNNLSVYNITSNKTNLFLSTTEGLFIYPYTDGQVNLEKNTTLLEKNEAVITALESNDFLLVGKRKGLSIYKKAPNQQYRLAKTKFKSHKINAIERFEDKIYVGTNKGLYLLKKGLGVDSPEQPIIRETVSRLTVIHDELWVATQLNGVYKLKNTSLSHMSHKPFVKNSLPDNTINTSFLDYSNNIWLGTFEKGVIATNNQKLAFNNIEYEQSCISQRVIKAFLKIDNSLLVGTDSGSYLLTKASCTPIQNIEKPSEKLAIYSFSEQSDSVILMGTNLGLAKINLEETPSYSLLNTHRKPNYFIFPFEKNNYLVGSYDGLYSYNSDNHHFSKVTGSKAIANAAFYQAAIYSGSVIFATSNGIAELNSEQKISKFAVTSDIKEKIFGLLNHSDELLFFGELGKLYKYTKHNKKLETFSLPLAATNIKVLSASQANNKLWLGTSNGLYTFTLSDSTFKRYTIDDGLIDNSLVLASSYQSPDGKLYFGGRNGFNAFYPEDIKDNLVPPKVALTKLTRFNEEVVVGEDYEGFSIESPIEYLDELEIAHRDYVMGFEFAGLHFADPMRNQYQYKLEGFHEDWVSTDAKNRTATFTNLSPGDYTFRVRAANKDGIWSLEEDNVALKIKVHPAPWLSWWAFTLYGLIVLGSILWFIRYRTQAAIARSRELELEVASRTKEIATQKNVIESLLERKNELFANISHEFRTPLTLILGPLEKELKALDSPKNPKHLQMIQRNATRLLGMVEQILKLTELKKEDTVNKVPHAVNPALEAIVESFASLAESKQIALSLSLDTDANVMAANDALEVMVGNLVSNAIKYTPEGGQVFVQSKLLDNTIQIQVTDTGVGMTKAQQDEVFERFVRLDKTSDIAGTGIGLSIVKELILAHDGQVQVESVDGQGSTFTITLPTTEQAALSDTHSIKSIEHLTQGDTAASEVTQTSEESLTDTQQELVLIIDDNPDMRDYIQEVLSSNYHCITADRGEAGIELAKAQVPDLIICDIMMPGIDGYEVAKRLRDDIITSHIPLVLLTAKGDKESRIQGWNENIDDYMTKPFDEEELRARVGNIIDIRNILSRKAGQEVTSTESKLDKASQPETQKPPAKTLNKKEQAFVDKLMTVIEDNYQNPELKRQDIASLMAISERQLQRKLKSLIDQSSIEILRELRLEKAAAKLQDGLQVNLVADSCGFGSPSHFIYSFKAKFGKTPKQFQTQH
ncbi:ATP-binding protein [Kangiella sp. HZ709]|uniref:hybrid sensor histidine kinase/response regulator transcription factor n=1 Tax=Kangiella sp. HZ709 TaxID=2666328 RepID=UPI0012AF903C|nr:ATP-binding protein [Kangiella sp. HZ709]MRX27298.1 response regulator [Kangiella sp. HZ709]